MIEVEYSYKSGFSHSFQGAARFRRQQRFYGLFLGIKIALGLVLLAFVALGIVQKKMAIVELFGAFFMLYLWFLALGHGFSAQKLRRVHGFLAKVDIKANDVGLEVREGKRTRVSPWSRVRSASIFREGIVLDGEKGVILWLPDSALKDASQKGAARQLIQTMVAKTKVLG